jgi:hypothetical protein
MANLNPSGIDLITGQYKRVTSADSLVDSSGGPTGGGGGLPTRYVEGLLVEYATVNTMTVTAGSCRNNADAADIVLGSKTTANITTGHSAVDGLAQLNGLDEKGLDNLTSGAITCSQSTTTITATGDITPHLRTRAITGTISSSTTTVTGVGTSFMAEVAIDDLIGTSTTYGWSRITDIDSDTSLTIASAFPGGDAPVSTAATVIYNATIQPNNAVKNKITTISASGTSISVPTSTSHSASSPLTIGVTPSEDGNYVWVAVWVIDNGSTPGLLLSTQHDAPLAPPSGYDSYRRVGWTQFGSPDDGTKVFVDVYYQDGGIFRYVTVSPSGGVELLNCGDYTSVFNIAFDVPFRGFCPRTSDIVRVGMRGTNTGGTNSLSGYVGTRGAHAASGNAQLVMQVAPNDAEYLSIDIKLDKARFAEGLMAGIAGSGYVSIGSTSWTRNDGFYDTL